MTHRCPEGVSIHDADTDELVETREWTVLRDDGGLGTLVLRQAGGVVRRTDPTRERSEG